MSGRPFITCHPWATTCKVNWGTNQVSTDGVAIICWKKNNFLPNGRQISVIAFWTNKSWDLIRTVCSQYWMYSAFDKPIRHNNSSLTLAGCKWLFQISCGKLVNYTSSLKYVISNWETHKPWIWKIFPLLFYGMLAMTPPWQTSNSSYLDSEVGAAKTKLQILIVLGSLRELLGLCWHWWYKYNHSVN